VRIDDFGLFRDGVSASTHGELFAFLESIGRGAGGEKRWNLLSAFAAHKDEVTAGYKPK
jgi:hypothetical protein